MTEKQVPAPNPASETGMVWSIPPERLAKECHTRAVMPDCQPLLDAGLQFFRPPVRSSAVRDFATCQRLHFFKYRLGLHRRGTYAEALTWGKLFHSMLELLIRGHSFDLAKYSVRLAADSEAEKLAEGVNPMGLLPDGKELSKVVENIDQNCEKAIVMAEVFCKEYEPLPTGTQTVATEKQIIAKVQGLTHPITITGQLDLLAREVADPSRLWIVDGKTCGEPPVKVAQTLDFDLQAQHYRLLAMAAYPELRVTGFIFNLMLKIGIKYCPITKDQGGFDSYLQRAREWYAEKQKIGEAEAGQGHPIPSFPVIQHKTRFVGDTLPPDFCVLLDRTCKATRCIPKLSRFPRCQNRFTCCPPGGRTCPMLAICKIDKPTLWVDLIGEGRPYKQENPFRLEASP